MLQLWFFANTLLWPFNIDIGGLKLGLNVVILSIIGIAWAGRVQVVHKYSANMFLFLFIVLLLSFIVAINGVCTDKLGKLMSTAPIFLVLIILSVEVGSRATAVDWLRLQNSAIWILAIIFAAFVVEAFLPANFPTQEGYRLDGKYSGLFNEPSHVAFTIFPIVAILLVAERQKLRWVGIISLCGLVLLSRSSTLLALITVWIFYRLVVTHKLKQAILSLAVILSIISLIIFFDYIDLVNPFLDRIKGILAVEYTDNISSLVYVQGWQDTWINLLRTNGMGLGFNMMGCNPLPDAPSRVILGSAFDLAANPEDGSFLMGKLISEMGVIGICFLFWLIWWLVVAEVDIQKYKSVVTTSVLSMQTVVIFSIMATFFIRTAGYFNGGVLLLVVAIAASFKWRRDLSSKL